MLRSLYYRLRHGDPGPTVAIDAAVEALPEAGEITVAPHGDAESGKATHAAHPELKKPKGGKK